MNSASTHVAFVVCLLLVVGQAGAGDKDTILTDSEGRALKGFDPVAYFTLDTAIRGDSAYSCEWADVKWLFISENHRSTFEQNPERYIPKYGGFCAYGVRWWRKVVTDPAAYAIVDDALYLNLNDKVNRQFLKHPRRYIKIADRKWDGVKRRKRD